MPTYATKHPDLAPYSGAEYRRWFYIKQKYGLQRDEWYALLERQGGHCAICPETDESKLHVDHDHQTNHVRGLLCASCNHFVGKIEASIPRFQSATRYLARAGILI